MKKPEDPRSAGKRIAAFFGSKELDAETEAAYEAYLEKQGVYTLYVQKFKGNATDSFVGANSSPAGKQATLRKNFETLLQTEVLSAVEFAKFVGAHPKFDQTPGVSYKIVNGQREVVRLPNGAVSYKGALVHSAANGEKATGDITA